MNRSANGKDTLLRIRAQSKHEADMRVEQLL